MEKAPRRPGFSPLAVGLLAGLLLAAGGLVACGDDGSGADAGSGADTTAAVDLPLVRRDRAAGRDAGVQQAPPASEADAQQTPPATKAAARKAVSAPDAPAPEASPATSAPSRGRIVYELYREGGAVDILRLDAGGAGPVALTRGPGRDRRPRWSPDGTRVAFFREPVNRDEGTSGDLWLVGADGEGLERLTDHSAHDFDASWMPDGRRIVFTSRRDGDDNLWMLDLEDGALRQLTHFDGGRAGAPSPMGDGRNVLYSADRMFSWQIWRLDLESGATERLTGPVPGACNSAWSAATGRFVHMSGGSMIGTDLVSRRPDGYDKTDVGSGRGNNHDPEFSQDGRRLVWVSDRDGNWEIYEAAADGSGERRVTRTPQDEGHPDLFLDPPGQR